MQPGNALYYGDNLPILRDLIPAESVDLVYLDPPFNSNRTYSVLFKDEVGQESDAQIETFEDTWHWGLSAARTYQELVAYGPTGVADMLSALRTCLGTGQMLAYLVMMAARLIELHRVLKQTGSLYLHCDPTASRYLGLVLDAIFGPDRFVNEIVWRRTTAHSSAKKYGPVHDVLLFYTKSQQFVWNQQYVPHDPSYVASHYSSRDQGDRAYTLSDLTAAGTREGPSGQPWRGFDPRTKGRHWSSIPEQLDALDAAGRVHWPVRGGWPRYRRYLEDVQGVAMSDVWADIDPLNAKAAERLGYPTQKPLALLKRIILASSNPGDTVLDPFCGCGTAVEAAERTGRRWVGIDITSLAILVQRQRLDRMEPRPAYAIIGQPTDLGGARQLALDDRYQFQWWALDLIGARPQKATPSELTGKKGADKGIDGVLLLEDRPDGKISRVLVQVKSGKVGSRDIRDLAGTVAREGAAMGLFVTLEPPTGAMRTEAASAGFYQSPWDGPHPALQILTVEGLLGGTERPDVPAQKQVDRTFTRRGGKGRAAAGPVQQALAGAG